MLTYLFRQLLHLSGDHYFCSLGNYLLWGI